jgi:hypothetical protein
LLRFNELFEGSPATTALVVNGKSLDITSWSTTENPADALAAVPCRPTSRVGPGAVVGASEQRIELAAGPVAASAACLRAAPSRKEPSSLDAEERLLQRYIVAIRDGAQTSVLSFDMGSVDIGALFPMHGDAPGTDPIGVPRPPMTRRILSAVASDSGRGVYVYESRIASAALKRAFTDAMKRAGFEVRAGTDGVLLFVKDGREVASVSEGAEPATLSILELTS